VAVQLIAVKGFLVLGLGFSLAQFLGSMVAMTSNYLINNEITYRDRRKTGWALVTGYLKFCALCSIGLAQRRRRLQGVPTLADLVGGQRRGRGLRRALELCLDRRGGLVISRRRSRR